MCCQKQHGSGNSGEQSFQNITVYFEGSIVPNFIAVKSIQPKFCLKQCRSAKSPPTATLNDFLKFRRPTVLL